MWSNGIWANKSNQSYFILTMNYLTDHIDRLANDPPSKIFSN